MRVNKDQICTVHAYEKSEYYWYDWKEEIKILGITLRKGGFYYEGCLNSVFTKTEDISKPSNNIYVDGKTVYYDPHIEIKMSNKKQYTKYFKTVEEMKEELSKGLYSGLEIFNHHGG